MTNQSDIKKLAEQIAGSINSFNDITAQQNRSLSSIYPIPSNNKGRSATKTLNICA